MPDVNYVITIKTDSTVDAKPKTVASNSSGERVDNPKEEGGFDQFLKKAKSIKKMAITGYALKYADLAITTHINRVELRTGNSVLQEKISYNYGMTKRLVLASAAIVGGALTGNPLAVVSGVVSIANIGIHQEIERKNLEIAQQVESIGISFANIRAGAGGGRSGNG